MIQLERNTSEGLNTILDLENVVADAFLEGPDHTNIFVCMTCPNDKVVFLADAPEAAIAAHDEMFGNAGKQEIVVWQANNEKHIQGSTLIGSEYDWVAPLLPSIWKQSRP